MVPSLAVVTANSLTALNGTVWPRSTLTHLRDFELASWITSKYNGADCVLLWEHAKESHDAKNSAGGEPPVVGLQP